MTEYGQRMLIECETQSAGSTTSTEEEDEAALLGEIERTFGIHYGATNGSNTNLRASQHVHTIRFQVVVWNIGKLDVASGSVPMTFRVSLFWNDLPVTANPRYSHHSHPSKSAPKKIVCYNMQGRHKAMRADSRMPDDDVPAKEDVTAVDVPPLSIVNVSTFTIMGSPEVDLLDAAPDTRLMRWTCMYRATVMQDHLSVHQFPHDCHNISLELAILTHRRAGQRWDRRFWKLGLATDEDVQVSRKTLRVPYGLVVQHVRIPEFHLRRTPNNNHPDNTEKQYTTPGGLQFEFHSQQDGSFDRRSSMCAISDVYLRVSLMVLRESGYYDRNIVPLLAFLNVVAATLTLILDPEKFFYRALLILNIAFNQMGIRLSVDKHLPSVGYEIRMQSILNAFFFVLLALILEAALVYSLETNEILSTFVLKWVDGLAALAALGHNAYTVASYYTARTQARKKYRQGIVDVTKEAGFPCRSSFIV